MKEAEVDATEQLRGYMMERGGRGIEAKAVSAYMQALGFSSPEVFDAAAELGVRTHREATTLMWSIPAENWDDEPTRVDQNWRFAGGRSSVTETLQDILMLRDYGANGMAVMNKVMGWAFEALERELQGPLMLELLKTDPSVATKVAKGVENAAPLTSERLTEWRYLLWDEFLAGGHISQPPTDVSP